MKEEGRVDEDLHPTMEVEDEGGCINKDLHATTETKDGGSVEIDLHLTTETRDEGGVMVLTKGGREIRDNGIMVLLVSHVSGMYVVKLGNGLTKPLVSFEDQLNLSHPFWRGGEVQQV